MPDLVIDLSHVEKTYRGKIRALRGITMQVHPGEIFGLLGPNGAGKSTLVKILMTVIRPSRCEGTMLGKPVGHKPTLGRVGYLPEHHKFPEYLTAAQVLDYFGALAKVDRRTRRSRAGTLLELVGIKDWRDSKVGGFSKGMRQRLGVAAAMVNDPDLIILDEPTDGVDPVGRREIRMVLVELKNRGKTIFLNSHLLSELEMVCDRVAILVQGEVASQGTIDSLTRDSKRFEIAVKGELPAGLSPEGTGAKPAAAAGPTAGPGNGLTRLAIPGDDAAQVQPVIDRLRSAGAVIVSITPVRESLEDLFMRAVADPTTGEARKPGAIRGKGGAA